MSGLEIYLLGKARVERDGEAVANPRGYKAWGLLAYLLRTDRPPSRDELVSLLFSEADDPFAALRWNLSALRRLLGDAELEGDPLRLSLPPGAVVDIETLISGSWIDALRLPGIERELLEGMNFSSSPAFDIWLLTERRHLGATAESVLREAALARLGAGDARAAADLAARLVQVNPFDENFQTLLVRSLAASGDGLSAARQVVRCTELFRRELGVEPSPAVAAAAQTVVASPTAAPVSGRAAARAQLEAGEAAIRAGSVDAGLQCLRRAVVDARGAGDRGLQAAALVALGSALVHAARGRDEEAAASLHEALAVAAGPELASSGAAASRELGYVEFLRGRYDRAQRWLVRAADLASEDGAERGRIACMLGAVLTDTAHYARAIDELNVALRLSSDASDGTQVAFTLAMLGRAHLLRGELDAAGAAFDESLACARRENWTAFTPWPEALRGDVDLASGAAEAAVERYEHAFALACQLGDPCWEGIAARGLGLAAAARDETDTALEWLGEARTRCVRLPDAWLWIEAYTLDALCSLAVEQRLQAAPAWIEALAALAARTGMRQFAASANVYRGRLGDDPALTAARLLAAEIDNPALSAMLGDPVAGAPARISSLDAGSHRLGAPRSSAMTTESYGTLDHRT
ncbi:MAG TPA: BTAD domain-containing putative transcriptional regulator [Solirubrobacteraceae bacterium]|nr:BTAD domain-containing putative transcriptional regulator [Solirubrobacteraceae bacterium]